MAGLLDLFGGGKGPAPTAFMEAMDRGLTEVADKEAAALLAPATEQERKNYNRSSLLEMLPNEEQVGAYVKQKFGNKADAIMANIDVETGGSFDWQQKQLGNRSDPAFGLFQFDPRDLGLAKPYLQYLSDTGKEDSAKAQIDFMAESLSSEYEPGADWLGRGNVRAWNEIEDPEEALEFFTDFILRPGVPHKDRRLASFQQRRNRG